MFMVEGKGFFLFFDAIFIMFCAEIIASVAANFRQRVDAWWIFYIQVAYHPTHEHAHHGRPCG